MRIMAVLAKYCLAGMAGWIVCPVQAAILYVVLLAISGIANVDNGGPMSGPFMTILGAWFGVPLVAVVVLPAVVVGDLTRGRYGIAWALPAALAADLLLAFALALVWASVVQVSGLPLRTWALIVGFSLAPLLAAGATAGSATAAGLGARHLAGRFGVSAGGSRRP